MLHTGSIATALEPGCDAVAELIDANAATSTISFDPNIRSVFFEDAEEALSRVETVVTRSDVVKASDEDLRRLDPHSSPEELAARWLTLGPSIVVVTFGAHGSFAICAGGDERIPAYPAEEGSICRSRRRLHDRLDRRALGPWPARRTPARPTARRP